MSNVHPIISNKLQAFFLVSDDIMDASITRRGQPCWYRNEGIGMIAINDSFMLESAIYYILKKHFRQESYYVDLLDLFHEVSRRYSFFGKFNFHLLTLQRLFPARACSHVNHHVICVTIII